MGFLLKSGWFFCVPATTIVSRVLYLAGGSYRRDVDDQGTTPHRQNARVMCTGKVAGIRWVQCRISRSPALSRAEGRCQSLSPAYQHGYTDAERLLSTLPARGRGCQQTRSSQYPAHLF